MFGTNTAYMRVPCAGRHAEAKRRECRACRYDMLACRRSSVGFGIGGIYIRYVKVAMGKRQAILYMYIYVHICMYIELFMAYI